MSRLQSKPALQIPSERTPAYHCGIVCKPETGETILNTWLKQSLESVALSRSHAYNALSSQSARATQTRPHCRQQSEFCTGGTSS